MEDGFPTLFARKRSLSHHGECWEGSMPSGVRTRRTASWKGVHRPQVAIDYSKLKELCVHRVLHNQEETGSKHDTFMAEYSSIFQKKTAERSNNKPRRAHSCTRELKIPLRDISDVMIAIHGREKEEQKAVDLQTKLKIILRIVKKLPIQRSSSEMKQLALLMGHFPSLLPSTNSKVLLGVAARAHIEITGKGYSLPSQGGTYLILQGRIEKLTMGSVPTKFSSEILNPGQTFGEMKKQRVPVKSCYPTYTTTEPCTLMRITVFNYEKVVESCKTEEVEEKLRVIKNCTLLHHVSPAVLTKLANAITWETIPANTTVISEGETIKKTGFIQEGKCVAYANVPRVTRKSQVHIGEVVSGDCIGETLLRGNEKQPYTIFTTSNTRIGWVTDTVIRVNEVEKHILSDRQFALPILTEDEIRNKYADKLMKRQWDKIRQDIVGEVITERGIRLGSGRWQHSRSRSDGERPRTSII